MTTARRSSEIGLLDMCVVLFLVELAEALLGLVTEEKRFMWNRIADYEKSSYGPL